MMSNNPFVKAVKEQVKGRMSITGPSGSGKTWTALLMATKLVELAGGRIALLDTEGQSSKRYASDFDFDVIDLEGDFNPQRYIDIINAAGEHGYAVLIIDSLTHGWNRQGGVLEIADKKKKGNNKWSGWAEARPVQNALSDAIVNTPVHLICTMREKTEWVVETVNGKPKPIKVGTKSIQSDEMVYEFDIAFKMDYQHALFIDKSRCTPLNDQGNEFTDVNHVVETIHAWLTDGIAPVPLWANINTVKEIFVGYREKGLTDKEIMGFAGVDKWDNYSQWGKYESQEDAIEQVNTIWDIELDIDKEQGTPDPASEYDGSVDEPPPETNGDRPAVYACEFTHSAYEIAGKHCVKFANCDPMEGANSGIEVIVVQAYGRSTEFRELIGDYVYEMSGIARYDDAKKTTKFEPLPDGFSIELEYVEKTIQKGRGKGKTYKEIIGVVGNDDSF
jgi:hypothetical protein